MDKSNKASSQNTNKPKATGLTCTTSVDTTRNNEPENRNQQVQHSVIQIEAREVKLAVVNSASLKRDVDKEEDNESDFSEVDNTGIDDEYFDPTTPYGDAKLKNMRVFRRKGEEDSYEVPDIPEETRHRIFSKYWSTFNKQLKVAKQHKCQRILGATCTQPCFKGGLHTPFTFLNHCQYEMRLNKCPIHTMLLVYLAKTYGWNYYRFGHMNFEPFVWLNPMKHQSFPKRANKSNIP